MRNVVNILIIISFFLVLGFTFLTRKQKKIYKALLRFPEPGRFILWWLNGRRSFKRFITLVKSMFPPAGRKRYGRCIKSCG